MSVFVFSVFGQSYIPRLGSGRSQGGGDLESPQDNVVVDGELHIWEIHLTVLECSGGTAWQTMLTILDNLLMLEFKEAQHGRLC